MSETSTVANVPQFHMGDRMRKALDYADVSVQQMADELDVSRGTVSNYMALRTQPNRATIRVWALRCGVPFEWLAHGVEADSGPDDPSEQVSKSSPCMTDNVTSLHTRRSAKQQAA